MQLPHSPLSAGQLGTSEVEVLAQDFEQRARRFDPHLPQRAIDV